MHEDVHQELMIVLTSPSRKEMVEKKHTMYNKFNPQKKTNQKNMEKKTLPKNLTPTTSHDSIKRQA